MPCIEEGARHWFSLTFTLMVYRLFDFIQFDFIQEEKDCKAASQSGHLSYPERYSL